MIENHLTEDYYWDQVMAAYRASLATLPTADIPYGSAYRAYRDALWEWLRFCYAKEPQYNGWKSWATWHAHMALTGDELPRYLEALRALGEATPEIYAEPDAIDWGEVWDELRAD